MTTWAEVDMLKATLVVPARGWRAFAVLVVPGHPLSRVRVRARVGDARLKLEHPCYFHVGAWRALGFVRANAIAVDFAHVAKLTPRSRALLASPGVSERLQVAFDEWLEKGGPRVTRPLKIEVTP